MLWRDPLALLAALFLVLVVLCALLGPRCSAMSPPTEPARRATSPPFDLEHGWLYVLGADALGRSILARLIVAAQNTIAVAAAAVAVALVVGGTLGLIAGYRGGWRSRPSSCGWPTSS